MSPETLVLRAGWENAVGRTGWHRREAPMRSTPKKFGTRVIGRALAAAVAVLLLTATPAIAAGPGAYAIVPGSGTFATLSANNLTPGGVASGGERFYLATTGTGLNRLPFRLHLFNQFYANIAISSYGNVQPGVTSGGGTQALPSDCLPTTTFGKPAVMVLWGELIFGGGSSGIFLRTQGKAPHRTFTISWQGFFAVSAPTTANAQVTFREDSQNLTYTYGPTTFQNGVIIGIQSKQRLTWAQRYCNTSGSYPTNGTRLTLTHSG